MPKIIGESLASHRELTRTRLFEALGSLMAEQAFESITMSQIAERAGVGRIVEQNTLGAVHLIHATLQGQRLPQDPAHRESALLLVETFILRGLGASEESVCQVTASSLALGE